MERVVGVSVRPPVVDESEVKGLPTSNPNDKFKKSQFFTVSRAYTSHCPYEWIQDSRIPHSDLL